MKLVALKDFAFGNLKCYDGEIFEYHSKAICAILIYRKCACEYTEQVNPPKPARRSRKKKVENEQSPEEKE